MKQDEIYFILKKVINYLVDGDYNSLYAEDASKRISPDELQKAIREYPGRLSFPPDEALRLADDYKVSENEKNIDFDLWVNGKSSDLTLTLNLKNIDGELTYSIEDIHVL